MFTLRLRGDYGCSSELARGGRILRIRALRMRFTGGSVYFARCSATTRRVSLNVVGCCRSVGNMTPLGRCLAINWSSPAFSAELAPCPVLIVCCVVLGPIAAQAGAVVLRLPAADRGKPFS